jgi:hypothetical protein
MPRTYIPTTVIEVHKQYLFMTRYQAVLRAAMVAIDPSYGALFDTLLAALGAIDAISQELYPLTD